MPSPLESHRRAIAAQQAGEFADEITPIEIDRPQPDLATGEVIEQHPHRQPGRRPAPGHHRWKAWPSCARCLPRAAASPPATARRPAMAQVR